jgi:hypothetical protein
MKKNKIVKILLFVFTLAFLTGFTPARDIIYTVPGIYMVRSSEHESSKKQKIIVNIPAFRVKIVKGNKLIKQYRCRVGTTATKTILGKGYISTKFRPAIFRYSKGEKAGEIIEYSRIKDFRNGRVVKRIKIPYEDVCGLEIKLNGTVTGQIFHSTTNPETLEYAHSHGCMGLAVDDMLDMYKRIKKGTKVEIIYEPVEYHMGKIHFYKDIYHRGINYKKKISEILEQLNISVTDRLIEIIMKRGKIYGIVDLDEAVRIGESINSENEIEIIKTDENFRKRMI